MIVVDTFAIVAPSPRMVVHGRRGQRAVVLLNHLLRLPNFELVAPAASEQTRSTRHS
jgi:hypothetical protein